jgi:hypothetical protein
MLAIYPARIEGIRLPHFQLIDGARGVESYVEDSYEMEVSANRYQRSALSANSLPVSSSVIPDTICA